MHNTKEGIVYISQFIHVYYKETNCVHGGCVWHNHTCCMLYYTLSQECNATYHSRPVAGGGGPWPPNFWIKHSVCVSFSDHGLMLLYYTLSHIWRIDHSRPVAGGGGTGLPFFVMNLTVHCFQKWFETGNCPPPPVWLWVPPPTHTLKLFRTGLHKTEKLAPPPHTLKFIPTGLQNRKRGVGITDWKGHVYCNMRITVGMRTILPWTRDRPRSIQVIASRGILDDIPPPIYHP